MGKKEKTYDEITTSKTFKSCRLNEHVVVIKRLNPLACENKYGIILDIDDDGLIEFGDDEADFAENYIVRSLTGRDKQEEQYKSFLTRTGEERFEHEQRLTKIRLF